MGYYGSMASHQKTLEYLDPRVLNLFHRNARRGDVAAIARSLHVNGQYRPIVVNRGTLTGRPNEVLAGNHTLLGARDLGWLSIDCYVIDVDDDAATRINIVDNRTSQLGGFDDEVLAALLQGFGGDLEGTGYTEVELADLEALLAPSNDIALPVSEPAPEQPAAPAEPVTDTDQDEVSGPRSIPLAGLAPRYLAYLGEQLPALRAEMDVETNADVLVMLVMTHTGIRPA